MSFDVSWQCIVLFSICISGACQTSSNGTLPDSSSIFGIPSDCPDPPMLKNGNFTITKLIKPYVSVTYHCNKGYELIGPSTLYCSPSLEYNPYRITLEWKSAIHSSHISRTLCFPRHVITNEPKPAPRLTCLLTMPKNPHLKVRDLRREYPVNSAVTYSCQIGYAKVEPAVRWCMPDGKWSPEEEPECVEEEDDMRTTMPQPTIPTETELLTIMEFILYISIPLLVVFTLSAICKLRKRNRQSRANSGSEHNITTYPQLLPTLVNGHASMAAHSHQSNTVPTAPPSELLYPNNFILPNTDMDAPVPVVEEPPSYDEVTGDNNLPSFEAAQRLSQFGTKPLPPFT